MIASQTLGCLCPNVFLTLDKNKAKWLDAGFLRS